MKLDSKLIGLIQSFKELNQSDRFDIDHLFSIFKTEQPDIKRATVNWRIHDLVQRGVLKRIGRGEYVFGNKDYFILHPDKKIKQLNKLLSKQLPYASRCLWRIADFKQFFQHIPSIDFIIIEVDREAVESVYFALKESVKMVLREPSSNVLSDFIFDNTDSIIVKKMQSESPIQICDGVPVPTLEKMLVDLYSEKKLFHFIEGSEFGHIFRNAVEKYTINSDKLLRYAARRGKKDEFQKMLNQINGNKP